MNIGLVVVLVLFLLFLFGAGNSLGQWYCADSNEEAGHALFSTVGHLLLAGLFGYWSYYIYCQEQREKYNRVSFIAFGTISDPNMGREIDESKSMHSPKAEQQSKGLEPAAEESESGESEFEKP